MEPSDRALQAGWRRGGAAAAMGLLLLLAPPSRGGQSICDLPPDPGPCDGSCPRWFFNSETGLCEEFTYGCCGGNENNFQSLEECQAACGSKSCAADVNGDGAVGVLDMLAVLTAWGEPGGPADVNQDGIVDVGDFMQVLLSWGACG